jgi:hypothetical protein
VQHNRAGILALPFLKYNPNSKVPKKTYLDGVLPRELAGNEEFASKKEIFY